MPCLLVISLPQMESPLLRRLIVVQPQRAPLLRDAYALGVCPGGLAVERRSRGEGVEVGGGDGEVGVGGCVGVLVDAFVSGLFISRDPLAFVAILG